MPGHELIAGDEAHVDPQQAILDERAEEERAGHVGEFLEEVLCGHELFGLGAACGSSGCPDHDLPLQAQTVSQMVDTVLALQEGTKLMLMAPLVRSRRGAHEEVFRSVRKAGFLFLRHHR